MKKRRVKKVKEPEAKEFIDFMVSIGGQVRISTGLDSEGFCILFFDHWFFMPWFHEEGDI